VSNSDTQSIIAPEGPAFEDVTVGMKLPQLVKRPTPVSLFMFSAAIWMPHRLHYDLEFARSVGLKNIIVHGPLQIGYLIQMITNWLGENGTLKKLSYRHHASAFPGDELTCKGVIAATREEGGKGCVDIELTLENQDKDLLVSGTATVIIPTKRPK